MDQKRPNGSLEELSTNKLFKVRGKNSKKDMEKHVKRALHSKNKMTIIYILFESLNDIE